MLLFVCSCDVILCLFAQGLDVGGDAARGAKVGAADDIVERARRHRRIGAFLGQGGLSQGSNTY